MAGHCHTTELGSTACDDLTELGSVKEGWLSDILHILTAVDTHSLALANRSLIPILDLFHGTDPASLRVKIRPTLSSIEAEYVSAIEWLVFDAFRVIALGTSCGFLLIYSFQGDLIHKQIVYPARILRLRVHGTKKDIMQDTSSEEICVAMPGLIAHFDGSEIQSMLQQWFQETSSQFWDEKRDADDSGSSHGRLPYQLWNVNKYGSCADAVITGVMPPPLLERQTIRGLQQVFGRSYSVKSRASNIFNLFQK